MNSPVRPRVVPALATGFLVIAVCTSAAGNHPSGPTNNDLLLVEKNPFGIKSRVQLGKEFTEVGGGGCCGKPELCKTLEPRLGWAIGRNRDIGLHVSWKLSLDETNTNWTAKAGVIWFF